MLLNYIFKVEFQYFLTARVYIVPELYPDTIFQAYIFPMCAMCLSHHTVLVLMFGNEYYNGNEQLINYATTTKEHVLLILATPATLNVRFCWKYSLFPSPSPSPCPLPTVVEKLQCK
jgi:hypothetical protein